MIGAIGFWATQIAILAAAFKAFGVDVSLAVVVQGFFVGMVANLLPLPGGVGGVDAGLVGAFVIFGLPANRRLPRRPGLPADRLLAAAGTRRRRLLPAAPHRASLGAAKPSRGPRLSGAAARAGHYFIK